MRVLLCGKEPRKADYPVGDYIPGRAPNRVKAREKRAWRASAGPGRLGRLQTVVKLAAQVGEEPEKERNSDAQKKARDDGEVKSGVFAAMHDVARKFSQAEGELVTEVQKGADKNKKCSKEKKRAAEIAERLHEGILPEAPNKSSDKTITMTRRNCAGVRPVTRPRNSGFCLERCRIRSAPWRKKSS